MAYWRDKVVLVTGGSAGFGKSLALSFARYSARVVLSARDKDRLTGAVEELRAVNEDVCGFEADVTRPEDVRSLISSVIDRHGRLDALINNVGQSDRGLALETPLERFQELWETNFLSAVSCTQAAMPHLARHRGHAVFMGSLASKVASPFLGAYAASKFPLAAFAQQLRLEQDGSGVHVLLVCPGPIARQDAGRRYEQISNGLPPSAKQPGGGVKLRGIAPEDLAAQILRACERRTPELIVPAKARVLFAVAQIFPTLGDWLIRRWT